MNEENLRKILGEKARELRKKAKMTQSQVAEKLGVYQNDLSAFETKGEKIGSLEKINELFTLFGYELTIAEKKTFVDVRINGQDLSELSGLVRQVNGECDHVGHWRILKQKLLDLILIPAKILDEVIDDNIREDEAMLNELRKDAASQANHNAHTQTAKGDRCPGHTS